MTPTTVCPLADETPTAPTLRTPFFLPLLPPAPQALSSRLSLPIDSFNLTWKSRGASLPPPSTLLRSIGFYNGMKLLVSSVPHPGEEGGDGGGEDAPPTPAQFEGDAVELWGGDGMRTPPRPPTGVSGLSGDGLGSAGARLRLSEVPVTGLPNSARGLLLSALNRSPGKTPSPTVRVLVCVSVCWCVGVSKRAGVRLACRCVGVVEPSCRGLCRVTLQPLFAPPAPPPLNPNPNRTSTSTPTPHSNCHQPLPPPPASPSHLQVGWGAPPQTPQRCPAQAPVAVPWAWLASSAPFPWNAPPRQADPGQGTAPATASSPW